MPAHRPQFLRSGCSSRCQPALLKHWRQSIRSAAWHLLRNSGLLNARLLLVDGILQISPQRVELVDVLLKLVRLRMSFLDHRQAEVNDANHCRLMAVHLVAKRPILAEQHLDAQQRVAIVRRLRTSEALVYPHLFILDITQELKHTQQRQL